MGVWMSSATSGAYLSSSIRSFCFLNWTRENDQRLSEEESYYSVLLCTCVSYYPASHLGFLLPWSISKSLVWAKTYVMWGVVENKNPLSFPKYLTTEVRVRRKQIISTCLNFLNYLCLHLDTATSEFTTRVQYSVFLTPLQISNEKLTL